MTVKDYITRIDKNVNYIEKVWFHRWLRWEISLYTRSQINMTDFKKIISVSTEEDYKINPDLTKDLMDYVAGEEIFSGHESYERNIEFDESNDYFEIIENKDIEFYEAIEKLRTINHIEIELKDIENKEINNENIILIHNLYNIWLDNGCF